MNLTSSTTHCRRSHLCQIGHRSSMHQGNPSLSKTKRAPGKKTAHHALAETDPPNQKSITQEQPNSDQAAVHAPTIHQSSRPPQDKTSSGCGSGPIPELIHTTRNASHSATTKFRPSGATSSIHRSGLRKIKLTDRCGFRPLPMLESNNKLPPEGQGMLR